MSHMYILASCFSVTTGESVESAEAAGNPGRDLQTINSHFLIGFFSWNREALSLAIGDLEGGDWRGGKWGKKKEEIIHFLQRHGWADIGFWGT